MAVSGYTLYFSVSQSGKPFRLVLPVTYRFAGGERKARLNLATQDQAYRVTLPGRPREIVLDVDYEVFRRPAVPEITPTLDRLLTRPNVVVVAAAAQAKRFAALLDILAAGEAALDLQWRPGPLKRRPGVGVPDRHWRDAFEPHRSAAGDTGMRDASPILLGRDNPRIGRLFGDLPQPDVDFAVIFRTDPRNPRQVIALMTAAPGAEWQRRCRDGRERLSPLQYAALPPWQARLQVHRAQPAWYPCRAARRDRNRTPCRKKPF